MIALRSLHQDAAAHFLNEVLVLRNLRTIAVAEDDPDDRELTREAFVALDLPNPLVFCNDGADLLDYLQDCAATGRSERLPGLVLLDLNMPRVCGREALRRIRADARLQHLPVVVLSTSEAERDRNACHLEGADLFLTKPPCFRELVELLRRLEVRFAGASPGPASERLLCSGAMFAA